MKKVLFFVAVIAAASMTSCTKDYTCTCTASGVESITEYPGLNNEEAEAAETACNNADQATKLISADNGCTWE